MDWKTLTEVRALVLELVQGETLADRSHGDPFPWPML